LNSSTRRLLVAVLTLLALAVPDAGAAVGPLEHRRSVADPSIAKTGPKQYVAVATGSRVRRLVSTNGVHWRPIGPALASRPRWARPGSTIWAADVVRVGRRWLLYYAAPVRGMGRTSRCIGVAAAPTSTGRFRPVGRRPLVCPPAARAPRAEDRILDRHRRRPTYPTIGAIDPSVFVDHGRVFLLYKTDGKPSSIRLLRLRANGLHARGRSRPLLAARGVVENPVMVRHGRWLYLFLSAGDYTRCSYSTVWRRSRRILHWRGRAQRTLLAKRSTGLCGPGGADVVVDAPMVRLYFHGWTCHSKRPCADAFHKSTRARGPVRALYAARLLFGKHGVRVGSFVRPPQRPAKRHTKKHRRHRHHGHRHDGHRHHAKSHHRHHAKHHAKRHRHHAKAHRHDAKRHRRAHRRR
jgi:arabinan endo-1,5-alpha-L-arabinosidase